MDFGRYNKFVGSIVGSAVGAILVWAAFQFPSIVTCAPGLDGTDACTALGFTQAQITGFVMTAISSAFVFAFPANKPPA